MALRLSDLRSGMRVVAPVSVSATGESSTAGPLLCRMALRLSDLRPGIRLLAPVSVSATGESSTAGTLLCRMALRLSDLRSGIRLVAPVSVSATGESSILSDGVALIRPCKHRGGHCRYSVTPLLKIASSRKSLRSLQVCLPLAISTIRSTNSSSTCGIAFP